MISNLCPDEDYGTIETPDGREIYFHRNSVLNADFDKLEKGARVHFTEELGEKGPMASSARIEGRQVRNLHVRLLSYPSAFNGYPEVRSS